MYTLEDYRLSWHLHARDMLWRWGLRASFKLFEIYCFLFRPVVRGVYIAVWYNEEFLLVENSYRSGFYFPSGGVKAKENPLEAAQRELSEEVGLEESPEKFVRAFEMQVNHSNMQDMVTIFELNLDEQPALALDRREIITARFVSLGDGRKLDLAAVVREYLSRKECDLSQAGRSVES